MDEATPRGTFRQYVPCIVTAALGVGLSVAAAVTTMGFETRHAESQFQVLAQNHFMIVQNGLDEYVNRLEAVRAFFDSSDVPVSRAAFTSFTRPLLLENAAIATLSWVPRVRNADRAAFEHQAALDGVPGYRIGALGDNGEITPAPEQSEYYPIFYATVPTTSPLYGLDLRSEPRTLVEMESARDDNRLGYSPVPTLVSSGNVKGGFIFSLPVYRRGAPHDSIEDRRLNLIGFVHGSLITSTMIDTIIAANKTPVGLDTYFFEPDSGTDSVPLYVRPSLLRTSPMPAAARDMLPAGQLWSKMLMTGGQPWLRMVVAPMPRGPLAAHHDRAWIVLIFGLIITGIIATYLRASQRHAMRMMRANQQVSDLAQTDALTSLANRRAFTDRLAAAFAACRRGAAPFAVIYFDLDHFKDVNDTLGHAVGDALLQQVAARVVATVRENDVVARIGGDEFAILQSAVDDLDAAGALATKIRTALGEVYFIDGNEVRLAASIGISGFAADTAGPDAMMIQADLALYRAKADGRNCVRFHSAELDREVNERVIIAGELRGAIARDELELYYQPQVELRSGRIVGVEALLRWNHPKRGRIPPAVFIPIAERSGQIQSLGQWVLDAVCRQLRLWQDAGIAPETVGVNFSSLQFKASSELDRDVAASLEECGIAPDSIEIELTESVLMEVTQQHCEGFERLRGVGIRIAIDDFGTGYSSLSYLANYPVSRIKIARELVAAVGVEFRGATVVRAAIRLAHELGIGVIAEGVETEAQEKFLLSAGCDHAQGYFFSKSVDAARATALLRSGTIKPVRPAFRLVQISAA
jgi:diguanylate cyclase (GGDEF)-like protein